MWLAGFLPSQPPSWGPEQIAAVYRSNLWNIRIGMVLALIGSMFYVPWTAILAKLIMRVDPDPIIPRWVGRFNVWFELSLIPLVVIFWFHSGPFAWNGIFGFYLPFIIFFVRFFVMTWTIRRSIHRLDETTS